MHALLFALGSTGDLLPFVGLGRALAARGHSVTVAANPHFAAVSARAGLDFVALGDEDEYHALCDSPKLMDRARGFRFVMDWVMLKTSGGFAGLGVRLVRDAAELDAAFAGLAAGVPLVAQRFVAGPVGNTVVLYDGRHGRGVPICWISAFKVRTWPGPFGPSSARQFMSHRDVEPIIRAVGARSGYHGFAALDWVLDENGRLEIIELNARPVPTIHMGPLAGVDFSRAVRELLAGAPRVQQPRPRAARVIPMFPEDVWRAASEEKLSLAAWLPWPGRFTDVPWHDPPLLLHHLRRFAQAARDARQR